MFALYSLPKMSAARGFPCLLSDTAFQDTFPDWRLEYQAALLEVYPQKLLERANVAEAARATNARLQFRWTTKPRDSAFPAWKK